MDSGSDCERSLSLSELESDEEVNLDVLAVLEPTWTQYLLFLGFCEPENQGLIKVNCNVFYAGVKRVQSTAQTIVMMREAW